MVQFPKIRKLLLRIWQVTGISLFYLQFAMIILIGFTGLIITGRAVATAGREVQQPNSTFIAVNQEPFAELILRHEGLWVTTR
jgi:hypothetical protein